MKINYLLKSLKMVWKVGSFWILVSLLTRIFLGIIPFSQLWITKELVETVSRLIQEKNFEYTLIFLLLLLQFGIAIFQSVLGHISSYFDKKMELTLDYELMKKISIKSLTVPYAYFELPEFYNHSDRIKRGHLGNKLLGPIVNALNILQSLISLMSYLGFLMLIHWSLSVVTLIAAIPIFIIESKYSNSKFNLLKAQTTDFRTANFSQMLLNNRQSAKEVRIFNLGNFLLNRWEKLFLKNNRELLQLTKKEKISQVILDCCSALLYGGAAIIVILLLQLGRVSIGQFVAMGQALLGSQSSVNAIASYLARIYEKNLYISDIFEYLDFKSEDVIDETTNYPKILFPKKLENGIFFKNVTFSYPKTSNPVLDNISFHIRPGEKIAIVGDNGSGKTTLIKCLMGLYQISGGNIYFDKISIKDIDVRSIQKNVTIIFQDFMKYPFTIKDNIAFGDIEKYNDIEKIKDIARKSDIHNFTNKFKDKYETYVGKLLADGVDLSGGQWQKIAIARALFRDTEIFILDEPTAALDPKSELDVFNKFNDLTKGKTTIFISHRMASAKMADRILVMKNGKIIEFGNHEELIEKKNVYYNMFNMQAKWYA